MRNKKPTSNQPASFAEVVRHVHHEIVRTCELRQTNDTK
jgi:hypothetical protein